MRGSRNALSEEVICAILRDFRQHGQKAVAKVRRMHPAAYLKICALLVPREMKLEHTNPLKSLSDEELETAIAAVNAMIAAEDARVIDGKAGRAALPTPDALSPEGALEANPKRKPNRLMMEADTAVGPRERRRRKVPASPGA
jgi:hypothetical protein